MCIITLHSSHKEVLTIIKLEFSVAYVCYSQMNTSGFQVHFLSFSRNISVQFIGRVICCRRHCGYTVDIKSNWEQVVCKFSIIM